MCHLFTCDPGVEALVNPGGRVGMFLRKVGNHVPKPTVKSPNRLPYGMAGILLTFVTINMKK